MKIDMSLQELLCWIGLFIVATNPYGICNDLIEQIGMKSPLIALASGAGFHYYRNLLEGKQ